MTDDAGLRQELKDLLIRRLRLPGVSPDSIDDSEPLVGGALGLDSIDLLELTLALEERYGFKIADEKPAREAFQSIATLAAFVRQRRAAAPDPGSARG
ncbi:MAG: acyl carrier protein [Acidobacteriia bacterium]|nr:acyl carrier protein [Terriglobia bacterium]